MIGYMLYFTPNTLPKKPDRAQPSDLVRFEGAGAWCPRPRRIGKTGGSSQ